MIEQVKIKDAFFFPTPNPMYRDITEAIDRSGEYAKAYEWNRMTVIASVERRDGNQWLHVSFSRNNRLPSYKEMQMIKKDFIGDDRRAIFVLPKKDNYVNIHKYCLHLWCCEKELIPDFEIDFYGIKAV